MSAAGDCEQRSPLGEMCTRSNEPHRRHWSVSGETWTTDEPTN